MIDMVRALHAQDRLHWNKGFTPRAVSVLEPHIRGITTSIIDDIAAQGRCDFVTDVAAPLPLAVEEILRWTSPVMQMTRVATGDVRLHGTDLRAGERVCLWYPSANRDETAFDDPYRFDIAREPNEHFCLGAGFARLELRVMFEELLHRLPDIAPDGDSERLRSTFIGGIKHMPVRYAARA